MKRFQPAPAVAVALMMLSACGGEAPAPAASAPSATEDPASAAPAIEPVTPIDYAAPAAWLCRPEVEDACEQDATATAVSADGRLSRDRFAPAADPPIDCFYVYPTVSRDETGNSDASIGPEEREIARQQAARFGSVCRIYAPVYRQVTLPALRQMMRGDAPATNRDMAYADVKSAWDRYVANDNAGRGVVLIGHDQGAGVLTRLIASEIDGKPVADQMVSALLIGTNLEVTGPHDAGGSFTEIGLCVSDEDINCAISYVSFRADAPPPADSLFGKAEQQGMSAACVNPAELDGSGGALKAMLPIGAGLIAEAGQPGPWTSDNPVIDTPFVTLPGMLSAQCVNRGGFSYLAITVAADPADKRTDTIAGDVMAGGKAAANWGLHLIDMHLAMGNLVDIVKSQSKAYASRAISRIQHPQDDK